MSFATTAALALALISAGVLAMWFTLILLRNHWEQICGAMRRGRREFRQWIRAYQHFHLSLLGRRRGPLTSDNGEAHERQPASRRSVVIREGGIGYRRPAPATAGLRGRRPLRRPASAVARVKAGRPAVLSLAIGLICGSLAWAASPPAPPARQLSMIVVVDPDCPHTATALEGVVEFRRLQPHVPVRVLIPDPSTLARMPREIIEILQRNTLTLDWDPGQLRALGVSATPAVVVVNAAGRGVRATGIPDLGAMMQAAEGR